MSSSDFAECLESLATRYGVKVVKIYYAYSFLRDSRTGQFGDRAKTMSQHQFMTIPWIRTMLQEARERVEKDKETTEYDKIFVSIDENPEKNSQGGII